MVIFIGIVLFIIVLAIMHIPIGFAFGIGTFALILIYGLDPAFAIPSSFNMLHGFAVLAIPLYVALGLIMGEGNLTGKIIAFIQSIVGRLKGSLGLVCILTCGFFGAISGSSASAVAAVGTIMIPEMEKAGYPRGYATGLVADASLISMLIPPSIPMILYGFTGRVSIAKCFLATALPGIVVIALYGIINFVMCRHMPLKAEPKKSFKETTKRVVHTSKEGAFALVLPVIVLGGIYSGLFTPTEAGAVGTATAIVIAAFVYHTLSLKTLGKALVKAGSILGTLICITFFLFILSRIVVLERFPTLLTELLINTSTNFYVQLALINIILLLLGMIMDDISGTILAAVLLLPVARNIGIDPVHFAAIVGINLGLGNVTPPVAPLLYMAGQVGKLPLNKYIKYTIPFIVFGHLPAIILTTYIPALSLTLPSLLFSK